MYTNDYGFVHKPGDASIVSEIKYSHNVYAASLLNKRDVMPS